MALLTELKAHRAEKYLPPHALALAYLGLGHTDTAFRWLERGVDEYDVWLPLLLNVDPWFDEHRADTRIQNLLRRMCL